MSFIPSAAVVKGLASLVVGSGAAKIAKQMISKFIEPETPWEKLSMTVGSWAIGGMVGFAAANYTEDMVDGAYDKVGRVATRMVTRFKLNKIDRAESTFEAENLNPDEFEKNKKGKWKPIKKSEEDLLAEILVKINLGETTFCREGLPREHFFQTPNGLWMPIAKDIDHLIAKRKHLDENLTVADL